jgi:2-dehydropantoate 2-reductase
MKVLIIGCGGVGGYFGSRLAAVNDEVHFIARGKHLRAMQNNGLHVTSSLGNEHIKNINVTDCVSDCGIADVVFVAVKLYHTDVAAEVIRPAVGANTILVSFQNGIIGSEVLTKIYGSEQVIGGSASIAARIIKPGFIEHIGSMALLSIGELDDESSSRTKGLFELCIKAGIDTKISKNINVVIWSKFIFLTAFSGITSAFRQSIGTILRDSAKRSLFKSALEETSAIARARGIALSDDLVDKRLAFADGLPDGMYSSMYHDLNNGKPLELSWLSGAVVDLGFKFGIETPTHQFFVDKLKNYKEGFTN